jgi:hypothetical protein
MSEYTLDLCLKKPWLTDLFQSFSKFWERGLPSPYDRLQEIKSLHWARSWGSSRP